MKKKVICVVHSNYLTKTNIFDSGKSMHFDFLNHFFKNNYSVLRHSLYTGGESRVYENGINKKFKKISFIGDLSDPLRYLLEILFNFKYLLLNRKNEIIYLGIDPLSSFPACFLKKCGLDIKVYFLSPDFAEKRFSNFILNKIYFILDKYCVKNCDKNICNSINVINRKKKIYRDLDLKDKFFHIPNIPNPWLIKKYNANKKIKNRIIYVGFVSSQIDFISIFKSIIELKKDYPDIHLIIVGSGDYEKELKIYIKKNNINYITLKGNLSHEDTLEEVSKAEIGLAIYNGNLNYDKFRDSCKIREYQALKTIPIITPVAKSNVDEIKKNKSGVIVENNKNSIKKAIKSIISNEELKNQLMVNCKQNYNIYKNKFQEYYSLLI